MSKKIILILLGFAFLSFYRSVFASPIINEFMYNLDGADIDWIEVYNGDNADIDLTTLKLLISNSTSNHGIVFHSGSQILHQGEYGIIIPTAQISAFTSKWGNSGNLFIASFSLPNESAVIEINNGDKNSPINSVSYDMSLGATEDGNSLQLVDGSWTPNTPTPGAENQTSGDDNNDDNTDNSTTTTGSSGSSKKTETKEPEIPLVNKTKITAQLPAFAGLPVEFKVNNTVSNKSCGKYSLNFGDGNFLETEKIFNIPEEFMHIYYYPGEYIVTLECYKSYLSSEPDSSDKIIVKVISSEVTISKVGNAEDFFIEIFNNSLSEADISGWILLSFQNRFVFPRNTIIRSKNKIVVSPKTTNFSILDKDTLKLINSEGEIIFNYSASVKPIRVSAKNSAPEKISMAGNENNNLANTGGNSTNIEMPVSTNASLGGPVDNLLAGAVKSDSGTENNIKYGMLGLLALLIVGTSAAYFIRNRNRKSVPETVGNDFEIIDG